jgi:hypothetical protein
MVIPLVIGFMLIGLRGGELYEVRSLKKAVRSAGAASSVSC